MEYREAIIIPLIEGPKPIASYEEIKEVLGNKVREYKIYGVLPERFLGQSDSLIKGAKVDIIVQGETEKGVFKLNLKEPFETFTDMMEIRVLAVNKKSNTSKVIHKGRYKKSIEIPQAIAAQAMKQTQADHLEIEIVLKGRKIIAGEGRAEENRNVAYAKMWDKDTEPEGKSVNRKEYNKKREEKHALLIIREVVKNGYLTHISVNGKKKNPPRGKLIMRLLLYILKHKGNGGNAENLLRNVWTNRRNTLDSLRDDVKVAIKKADKGKLKDLYDDIQQKESTVRPRIVDLNKFLKPLNVKVEANSIGEFELNKELDYLLIEKY